VVIFLSILKVIGIVLLALLGFILLVLLLVLFAPITYRVSGYRKEEMESFVYVRARLSWLFGLVRAGYIYPDKPDIIVKFLFFTVYHSGKSDLLKGKNVEEEIEEDIPQSSEENKNTTRTANEEVAEKIIQEKPEPLENEENESSENTFKSFIKKIIAFFKNISYTIGKFYDRIKDACAKVKDFVESIAYYIELLQSEEMRRALDTCGKQLKKIGKNIRPRKIRANLLIGTSDPASTGKILELYSILYPYIGQNVNITPDFDRSVVIGDFFIRGRITSAVLLWAAWVLYKDRDIRRVIDKFKRRPKASPDFAFDGIEE
jgi:hypothetical protein